MTHVCSGDNLISDNRGFSLVELIVCIAIVAIATIPLMSAFSTSGIVIGKAQSIQNATSVAESVMEEIKGSTIEQLKNTTDYVSKVDETVTLSGFNSKSAAQRVAYGNGMLDDADTDKAALVQKKDAPFYVFYKPNVKSNDGESFNVVATIDATESYIGSTGDTAIDANSIELPVIERIDKGRHAVISKEINRLDSSAVETWKNNYRDKNHLAMTETVTVSSMNKEVEIKIDESGSAIEIGCTVKYYVGASYASDEYHIEEKVYSGTFVGTPDSRAYVFYQTARQSIHSDTVIKNENVIIKSTSDIARNASNPRQVYFILQEDADHLTSDSNYYMLDAGKTKMSITADDGTGGTATKVTNNSQAQLSNDGIIESQNKALKVVTNLPKNLAGEKHFYYKEKDDYIYEINVYVYDDKDREKAHLTSTKNAK